MSKIIVKSVTPPGTYLVETLSRTFEEDEKAEAETSAQEQANKLGRPIKLQKFTPQSRNVSIGTLEQTYQPEPNTRDNNGR